MSELDGNVEDFLDTVNITLSKELKYIKDNNWALVGVRSKRVELHNLQALITDRAVRNATRLYELCKQDTAPKNIKSAMKRFIEMYEVYNTRYESYTKKEDWTTYIDRVDEMSEEIEFQSDIQKNVGNFKTALRKINFGGEGNSYDISFRDNAPAPFMMQDRLEKLYPEIQKIKDGIKTKTKGSSRKDVEVSE